jgi:molybdate transport system substrate-binding protein
MIRFAFVAVLLFGVTIVRAQELTVAAAVSLKDVLTQIAADRKAAGQPAIQFVFGSSGQLQQQIVNGAPIDVFISAAPKQIDELIAAGTIDGATRRDVASNRLVLIAPPHSALTAQSLASLDVSKIKKLAVGEPNAVPAGQYAAEAMEKAGIASQLAERLIFATNVRQVLSYVERGEVTAGIVYASDAKVAGDKVKVIFKVDPALHTQILYTAGVNAKSANGELARVLINELLKEPAQKKFAEFGFVAPTNDE